VAMYTQSMRFPIASPSSSPVQDTGLSRRRQGFKSPWGRHLFIRQRGVLPYQAGSPSSLPDQYIPLSKRDDRGSNPLGDASNKNNHVQEIVDGFFNGLFFQFPRISPFKQSSAAEAAEYL
jgi:hypothetical protein